MTPCNQLFQSKASGPLSRAFLIVTVTSLLVSQSIAVPTAWSADVAPAVVVATEKATELPEADKSTLRDILSGKTTSWPDGTPIVLVLPPPTSVEMSWLCNEFFGVSVVAYRQVLAHRIAHGSETRLVEARDAAEVKGQLLATPGSVGPLLEADLSSSLRAIVVE